MFRVLLAHLQEALHKQLVHCVRVRSAGCYRGWSATLYTIYIYTIYFTVLIYYNARSIKYKDTLLTDRSYYSYYSLYTPDKVTPSVKHNTTYIYSS
jgi:hypothetical protein